MIAPASVEHRRLPPDLLGDTGPAEPPVDALPVERLQQREGVEVDKDATIHARPRLTSRALAVWGGDARAWAPSASAGGPGEPPRAPSRLGPGAPLAVTTRTAGCPAPPARHFVPSRRARPGDDVITSVDNRHVREVVSLRRSRERRRLGLFVAEGPREVERARSAGLRIVETFFAPSLLAWNEGEPVSERVLAKMAYRAEPEGVIAVVEAPRHTLPPSGSLYLVAVGVEKPGNLGAMARSAVAAGADALLVAEARVDAWNPNAIRASTGAVFSLPIIEATLEQVAALGVSIVAASPAAESSYTDVDLTAPTAIVVGAEDSGLAGDWLAAADARVAIPVAAGGVDSLNAATAAAVLLYEAVRQRG